MNDTAKIIVVFAAVAAGLLAWTAWTGESADPGQATAWTGAKIDWGKPARHGCSADWLSQVLPLDHPIYRQWVPGANRSGLMRHGWTWITDPPSEQGIGDE